MFIKSEPWDRLSLYGQFLGLPRTLTPFACESRNQNIVSKNCCEGWTEKQANSERYADRLRRRLEERKRLKGELLKAKRQGEVFQADYEEANGEFTAEIANMDQQLQSLTSNRSTVDAFVRFAELHLTDMARAWEIAGPEERQRV